ncbi:MAG: hypothetical protein ACYC6M_13270 [Terriglobales bacterium]
MRIEIYDTLHWIELVADAAAEKRHAEYQARTAIVREAKRALVGPLPLTELDRILPAAHPGRAPRKDRKGRTPLSPPARGGKC